MQGTYWMSSHVQSLACKSGLKSSHTLSFTGGPHLPLHWSLSCLQEGGWQVWRPCYCMQVHGERIARDAIYQVAASSNLAPNEGGECSPSWNKCQASWYFHPKLDRRQGHCPGCACGLSSVDWHTDQLHHHSWSPKVITQANSGKSAN